jgi:hypothetical protein
MTDDDRDSCARFLLLSDANYTEWAMRMEAELIEKGLWEQVFVELDVNGKTVQEIESERVKAVAKRNAKKMGEARARMIMRVETLQLVHMHKRDPMVIWAKLAVVNGVLLPSIALNCLPGCCTRMFNCSGILD